MSHSTPLEAHGPWAALAIAVLVAFTPPSTQGAGSEPDDATREALSKQVPETIDDLLAIQTQLQKVLPHSLEATVGVLPTDGSGSGVIISEDGYVLTAGHVSGKPGTDVVIVMRDGRHLKAKSLGNIAFADAGLIQITEPGIYPFAEMGSPGETYPGDWCFALGHPGGIDEARGIVVRLGRIIRRQSETIQTDCRLVGGDSGGPLFDMEGRVIGINSRIKADIEGNYHVTIRMFKRYWEEMREGKMKTSKFTYRNPNRGLLGVTTAGHARGVQITVVLKDSPARFAKLSPGDIIIAVDGQEVTTTEHFSQLVGEHGAGDVVRLTVEQLDETREVEVTLDERPKDPNS
jgi:serine protease Do